MGFSISDIGKFIVKKTQDGVEAGASVFGKAADAAGVNFTKGIEYYAFLDGKVNASIKVQCRGHNDITISADGREHHTSGSEEMKRSDLSTFEKSGRFTLSAQEKNTGTAIATKYVEVSPTTGNVTSGDMSNMLQTPSITGKNGADICYGFYDSGSGDKHVGYMYVTTSQKTWMTDLIRKSSNYGNTPFSYFLLPGAHDSGMYLVNESALGVPDIVKNATYFIPVIGTAVSTVGLMQASRAFINLGVTQKDTTAKMLELGIRYFDFRPGYCTKGQLLSGSTLYHQHAFIPGQDYNGFLTDVKNFLTQNTGEIVVVALSYSGFVTNAMKPTQAVVDACFNTIFNGSGIVKGGKEDIGKTYNQLITEKKRILFLNNGNVGFGNVHQYDSYSDNAYKTRDYNKIIAALNSLNKEGQANADVTIFQLQGTSSGETLHAAKSVASLSEASSPLLGTKAPFDSKTYAWVQQNIVSRFRADKLAVLLNDFADNQMVHHCATITEERMKTKA